jgi:superfamily I DNA/RNA helicase
MLLEKEGRLDDNHTKPGPVGINLLHKFFTSSFKFTQTLSSILDAYDKRISKHTDEQKKILEFTSFQKRALIFGGAGTGKTFLAQAKAMEFANQGLSTLLVYFNSPIVKESRKTLGDVPNLSVQTFHGLCRDAALALDIEIEININDDFFEKTLPEALERALSENKVPLFDAIIIDEAQDLKETWLETILLCLKNLETGRAFVFADDNQNLYQNAVNLPKILECSPLTLTKNVRNTERIFSFAQNFYSGITSSSSYFDGPEVRYEALNSDKPGKELLKFLLKLRDSDGIHWENIAVLSMNNRDKSSVFNDLAALSSIAGEEKINGKFVFDSVWKFKGLESQVVIVVDIEDHTENKAIQYVAATRARTLLVFCGPSEFSGRFNSLLHAKNKSETGD